VAIEKLASEKSERIKTREEAPRTIFSGRLDIFYLPISAYFEENVFQQPKAYHHLSQNLTIRGLLVGNAHLSIIIPGTDE
jgi:hypothetical protein